MRRSSHVADLAVFLGGLPQMTHGAVEGALDWHRRGGTFAGHARGDNGVLFAYAADWRGPGRWSVEVTTPARRFILCPLESLRVQHAGSFQIDDISLDDAPDRDFKPGLYRMVEAFLSDPAAADLCSLSAQARASAEFYDRICPPAENTGREAAAEKISVAVS